MQRFRRRHPLPRLRDRDEGYIIAVMALVLTSLMIFAGFTVDVGGWYARASQIRRAADAAALAGVVWMPDLPKATQVARQTAEANGFPDGGTIDVQVDRIPGRPRQLKVTITDGDVAQYFSKLVRDNQTITRAATAEYVLPVPLGSPRNYFGTGDLGTGERLWLSVNTWCTDKVDGDRHQSRYRGNRPYSALDCPDPPSGSKLNDEYRDTGYEFYVDAPEGRGYSIDLLLHDAKYEPGVGPDLNLSPGNTDPHDYTYTLFAADNTPLDDTDNPVMPGCGATTFTATTPFDYPTSGNYLGTNRWNRLCTITAAHPDGRYILRVTNTAGQRFPAGANNFSIVARPSTFPGAGLCDGRTDADCPGVYGKDAISVFADQSSSTADFFLSEIAPVHVGKTLRISLFDPGEGGNNIRIRRPTGTNTWTDATFSWTSSNGSSGNNVTSLDVTSSVFNGHTVDIDVDLAGYSPPGDNHWWQIRYNFGSGNVTDRTTWTAAIIGDPVHLVSNP